jgi:hypothetical protein
VYMVNKKPENMQQWIIKENWKRMYVAMLGLQNPGRTEGH